MIHTSEYIQQINKPYVGDDCIQIMIPYKNAITILNEDGILFNDMINSNVKINKYLEDERRKQFPYSNIPTHYSKEGLFKKVTYSNQLLEFEKPYIIIRDGVITENFVIKDNDRALLINSLLMKKNKRTKHMTYNELLSFVQKDDDNCKTYYTSSGGALVSNSKDLYPTEEELYCYIKNLFNDNFQKIKRYILSDFVCENPYFLYYIEKSINNIDLSLIDFNLKVKLNNGEHTLFIITTNNSNIKFQSVNVTFVRKNDFKIDIYDIPIAKYTLNQLKFSWKIHLTNEPKIPLKLNPGITKQDIKNAKKMKRYLQ